jgi:hypothetical protein
MVFDTVFTGSAIPIVAFSANIPKLDPVFKVQMVAILIPYSIVFIGILWLWL